MRKDEEMAVQGVVLCRHFLFSIDCCFDQQIMGKRKPPDLKAYLWQAAKQESRNPRLFKRVHTADSIR